MMKTPIIRISIILLSIATAFVCIIYYFASQGKKGEIADNMQWSVDPAYNVTTADDPRFGPRAKQILKELQTEQKDTFSSIIRQLQSLRNRKIDAATNQSLDLILRELCFLQKLARGELVVITPNDTILIFGSLRIQDMEDAMKGYGLVIPETGWKNGAYLGAKGLTREDWLFVKNSRILSGKWKGGYKHGNEILLPGLKCFEE